MTTTSPAADLAHLCDHPADAFGTQGCPRWPACLAPAPPPGLLMAHNPMTPEDVEAFKAALLASKRQIARVFDLPETFFRPYLPRRPRGYRGTHRRRHVKAGAR